MMPAGVPYSPLEITQTLWKSPRVGVLKSRTVSTIAFAADAADDAFTDIWPYLGSFANVAGWVPYHHILGPDELFVVREVHSRGAWTDQQRFQAMFVFRAHCRPAFFTSVQLPRMLCPDFWLDPIGAFGPDSPMEEAMLEYRRANQVPLLTSAVRMVPPRVLEDDDHNLVRSITVRTVRLLQVAEEIFPIVQNRRAPASERITEISQIIQKTEGFKDTWAKMLTVCIDLAYPEERFLAAHCDVGVGAKPLLEPLLGGVPFSNPKERSAALRISNILGFDRPICLFKSTHIYVTIRNPTHSYVNLRKFT